MIDMVIHAMPSLLCFMGGIVVGIALVSKGVSIECESNKATEVDDDEK